MAGSIVTKPEFVQGASGIKLHINFVRNTIWVTGARKRDASHLDADTLDRLRAHLVKETGLSAARIANYSKEELEAAISLAGMPFSPPSHKKLKLGHNNGIILKSALAARKQRIVDPKLAADALLILGATKASSDVYDSDADSLDGDAPSSTTTKPELFRNIQWGSAASDYSNDADFPTEPSFDQFVPGRWERLADGTLKDQKHKLLVRLTSKDGRKMIFKNPPPKDWNDQKAITALNKRVSQQIRRNTEVRFRLEVEPYVREERAWICDHLLQGKPANGWKAFVEAFNAQFVGKVLVGCEQPRPERTHSSLTKEIERFGKEFYGKGKVPEIQSKCGRERASRRSQRRSRHV
ncbi:hypothetical protein DPSP01_013118 [Paraphaeosphaeria sporulosa]|uniref:Uncharacterized protein n=1 Tax=Paraphaeosphaeria sporulosa TaxID=1460663 RepID=A0A177D097_9PLEO|nr:uncharacterized protein CC84DRAFT_1159694 [Paraphaeosphaeria sporulosa]OAG12369.1 hypothetical protein CC84DRAFT_1159694 [Paraphaeosphaeria sporulosa]